VCPVIKRVLKSFRVFDALDRPAAPNYELSDLTRGLRDAVGLDKRHCTKCPYRLACSNGIPTYTADNKIQEWIWNGEW
jgi:hypothetical protein